MASVTFAAKAAERAILSPTPTVPPRPHVPKVRQNIAAIRVSQNVASGKLAQAAMRRKEAAEWVKETLGTVLPHKSDLAFRLALKDGVTLCRCVNLVAPLSVPQVVENGQGGVYQSMENVGNFLRAVKALGLPQDSLFLASELDAEDGREHPRVAMCLLELRCGCSPLPHADATARRIL